MIARMNITCGVLGKCFNPVLYTDHIFLEESGILYDCIVR